MKKTVSLAIAMALVLGACAPSADQTAPSPTEAETTASTFSAVYPLKKQFACLPDEAAIIAAHRAVSKGEGLAENSAASLNALMARGYLVAEIDVAGLKDGTHILYHDGVWEEKSTGEGPVAAASAPDLEKILLLDTDGELTSDRPLPLDDALAMVKDRLYLEIDFKSSAKYETVIDAVRRADMADQVILIAYNDKQARRMAELAPEMMLSVGVSEQGAIQGLEAQGVKRENMAAWIGRGPYDAPVIDRLQAAGLPILAWPGKNYVNKDASMASLIVSDFAFDHKPIVGLDAAAELAYMICLES